MADDWSEDEYIEALQGERRRFAWVMQRYGGLTPAQAKASALSRYPYETSDTPFRGIIFHELAWKWAMRAIHGNLYWVEHPELAHPSPEYEALH